MRFLTVKWGVLTGAWGRGGGGEQSSTAGGAGSAGGFCVLLAGGWPSSFREAFGVPGSAEAIALPRFGGLEALRWYRRSCQVLRCLGAEAGEAALRDRRRGH